MTSKDLHTAIIDSNWTVGRQYIGRCSQVYRGIKAIHLACGPTYTKKGNITCKFVEKLVDNGADVDDPDENGLTAIMLAASHQVDPGPVISLLCSLKADLSPVDSEGRSAFHRLCKNDKIVNARSFLDAASEFLTRIGGDQQDNNGYSPFHYICDHRNKQVAMEGSLLLVEKGADFRLTNNDGKTPEDLLMENANLNKTDIDKVKCAIWVLKDKAEQDKENQGQKEAEKIETEQVEEIIEEMIEEEEVLPELIIPITPPRSATPPPKTPSPEPVIPTLYNWVSSSKKEIHLDGPLASDEDLYKWLKSKEWQGTVLQKLQDANLMDTFSWVGGNKSKVMKWVRESTDGRQLLMPDRQIIKSACSKWNKIYKIRQ